MATLGRSHDFPVIRGAELANWHDGGDYEKILGGEYLKTGDPISAKDDLMAAGKNFSGKAAQVFEDTDRYVNEALTNFFVAARKRFEDE